ncbi:MAG TPA: methyltransferase domain-containing protein, partial [Longimicrobium sp.]|nr:methyltransferase domain-containing protein [Longimicrobium sp.]
MLYDDQATRFDDRAGVPADAAEAVARELSALVGLAEGWTLLDVGCGTGSLSLPLLRLPIRYTGFDRSAAMLEVFRERAEAAGLAAELHVADGNARWPAEDAGVDVVFSARALHHLHPAHVAAEARRVIRPGGWLATGRVRRPPDSPKSVLRRQMRRMLQAEGFAGRSH